LANTAEPNSASTAAATGQDAAGCGRYRNTVKDANTSSTLSASERPAR